MKRNKIILFGSALIFGLNAQAGQVDGSAVLGSAIGAAAGSAIGSASGGKEGAIIGGGVGGAIGAAVGSNQRSSRPSDRVTTQNVIVVDGQRNERFEQHDNGKHKGQYKHKHRNGRDHD